MSRHIGERVFVLLFCINFIRGTELLYIRGIKTHTFLQLCCNEQSFALCLRQFRFYITAAANGQHIRRDISAISAKNTGYHIPKSGLTVSTFAVGNNQSLHINLAHCRQTYDSLHIINKSSIFLEEGRKGILPNFHTVFTGVNRSLLGNEIFGIVFTHGICAFTQITGA